MALMVPKGAKQSTPVKAEPCREDTLTKSGEWARAGQHHILTGPDGHTWPVINPVFTKTYQHVGNGFFRKKADAVHGIFDPPEGFVYHNYESRTRAPEGLTANPAKPVIVGVNGEMWQSDNGWDDIKRKYDIIKAPRNLTSSEHAAAFWSTNPNIVRYRREQGLPAYETQPRPEPTELHPKVKELVDRPVRSQEPPHWLKPPQGSTSKLAHLAAALPKPPHRYPSSDDPASPLPTNGYGYGLRPPLEIQRLGDNTASFEHVYSHAANPLMAGEFRNHDDAAKLRLKKLRTLLPAYQQMGVQVRYNRVHNNAVHDQYGSDPAVTQHSFKMTGPADVIAQLRHHVMLSDNSVKTKLPKSVDF
jgi:hypothetical protein